VETIGLVIISTLLGVMVGDLLWSICVMPFLELKYKRRRISNVSEMTSYREMQNRSMEKEYEIFRQWDKQHDRLEQMYKRDEGSCQRQKVQF
jgi:hypothetical protein